MSGSVQLSADRPQAHPLVVNLTKHSAWLADLNISDLSIVPDGDKFNFNFRVDGKIRTVTFNADLKSGKLRFKNGQPHECETVEELIQEIFHHCRA